jgi:hypothetical protein
VWPVKVNVFAKGQVSSLRVFNLFHLKSYQGTHTIIIINYYWWLNLESHISITNDLKQTFLIAFCTFCIHFFVKIHVGIWYCAKYRSFYFLCALNSFLLFFYHIILNNECWMLDFISDYPTPSDLSDSFSHRIHPIIG